MDALGLAAVQNAHARIRHGLQQINVRHQRPENGEVIQTGTRLPQRPVNNLPVGVRVRAAERAMAGKSVQGVGGARRETILEGRSAVVSPPSSENRIAESGGGPEIRMTFVER